MGNDRVIIVRVLGTGFYDEPDEPLTLTSRAGLSYLPTNTINGVIAEMGAQLSSEIPVFGSMGSDPTTYFSVLSLPLTLAKLLGRSTSYVRDSSNGAAVRTTFYVNPSPTPSIYCDDTTFLTAGDLVRIGGSALRVTGVATAQRFTAEYIFGSNPVPIPMQDQGTGQTVGATINALRLGETEYPSGGIEQLPIIISTAPTWAVSAANEEVIFRGMVSKVGIDTSARGTNQIKVDCSSILGMIRNTPWRPAAMSLYFWNDQYRTEEGLRNINGATRYQSIQSNYRADLSGPLYDFDPLDYSTRLEAIQLRKDKTGGLYLVDPERIIDRGNGIDYTINSSGDVYRDGDGSTQMISDIPVFFSDGIYATTVDPILDVDVGVGQGSGSPPSGSFMNQYNSNGRSVLEWVGEICFVADSVVSLVVDLLFGTFNINTTGTAGARAAGMSAWLPFGWQNIQDIIDVASLNQVFGGVSIADALPSLWTNNVLPYQHGSAKTVGDVLDWLLKRTGSYVVYDRGKIYFNQWTTPGVWPRSIDDIGLAEPIIGFEFDRENAVQVCEVDWATSLKDKDIARAKYTVANTDRLMSASGKTVSVGNFIVPWGTETELGNSQSFQTAVAMVQRYSKAAAVVTVTYRDSIYDLNVGEFVSLSSDKIPNAGGTMGVIGATGYVLKAERSWKTPTTKYTIWLYGYLTAVSKLSVVSSSGRVREVIDDYTVKIDTNIYTLGAPFTRQGAPASDAASFQQSLVRYGGKLPLQLLDEYGTPYFIIASLTSVDVPNDTLTFDNDAMKDAKVGDVIVIAPASSLDPDKLATMFDATQAKDDGTILGDETLCYPWMV